MPCKIHVLLVTFLLFAFMGCADNAKKEVKATIEPVDKPAPEKDTLTVLEEEYTDSTTIGVKGRNKLELKKFRNADSVYVDICFFEKRKNQWKPVQRLHFLKDGITGCDVAFSDFNNDGYNDFTFKSSVAARGANEIRKLLIFDKNSGKLVFLKNSEQFPNIRYNKVLDCIDGFRVYGGSQTAFAKIEGDSLREFANVEVYEDRIIVNTIDKNGKEKNIKNETYEKGSYIRFENFAPLRELQEEY